MVIIDTERYSLPDPGEEIDEAFPEKDMRRAKRRKTDVKKAIRKRAISKSIYEGFDWYNNLHQYSKNKIYCSCPLCSFDPWKSGNLTMSDLRKQMADKVKLKEYDSGEHLIDAV